MTTALLTAPDRFDVPDFFTSTVTDRYRVVVADDHPLFRRGIVRALESSGDFSVVGEAQDGAAALELIRSRMPDIALLDVRMPELDGVDVVGAIALHGPDIPIVLLSAFSDHALVTAGLEAGAAAYISKRSDRDAICQQLATIASAHCDFAPRQLTASGGPVFGGSGHYAPRLTVQEHELLRLAGTGMSKLALERELELDEAQLRSRIASVRGKLDAETLGAAVERARALELIR